MRAGAAATKTSWGYNDEVILMIWRQVMLAASNVDYIPTHVVDRVGRIVRGLGAELELFSSIYEPDRVQPQLHEDPAAVIASLVEDAHRRLERIADMFREQTVRVRCSVRWDYPACEAVIRQVLRHHIDLLILPATAVGESGRRTLRYRETRLIETCPCPLLLLKSLEVYGTGPIVAAVDPLHAYELPEELDEGIIDAARTLSYSMAEAPVYLYHADVATQGAANGSRAHARVRSLGEQHNIPAANVRIERGAVESALPAFARLQKADVIVMGALSRAYPQRAILGHKAEQVLDAVACDVLVVKPRGFTYPVSTEAAPAVPVPSSVFSS
jgi:universal stress protein E